MTEKTKRLVVFDLDGTLNRTELYAVPAHKKALAEYGIFDKTDEMIISTFGARAQDSIPILLNGCDELTCMEYMKKSSQYEDELIKEFAGEYDGVSEMLDKLKANNYLTAVCSNASERYIRLVLDALNLTDKIDYIQPLLPDMTKNDTLSLLLAKVQPHKALMVGDRIFDKLAAWHNHLRFIGCLYGFDKTEIADANVTVASAHDIFTAVEALME